MHLKPQKKILREFGLLVGFTFPILIGLIIPLFTGHNFRIWTLWISIPLIFLSFFSPKLLATPYAAWMKLGNILGYINSRIILGAVFLLVLQPIALIMKFFNYDPLRKKKKNVVSYKEISKQKKVDLKRIF